MPEFAGNEMIATLAASCGIDVEQYVTWEAPGFRAFALEDGMAFQTYSADPRDLDFLLFYGQLLGRAPTGGARDVMVSRHDEYKVPAGAGQR